MAEEKNTNKETREEKAKRQHRFLYLGGAAYQLRTWINSNPEFSKQGDIEYFYGFLCPVSTASVKVTERADSDYDIIQFTVLKIFSAGIKDPKLIAQILGLTDAMVVNILNILTNGYHHIDNNEITAEGRESLTSQTKIEVYETTKRIQFEALTGTILPPELFQENMDSDDAYFNQKNPDNTKMFPPRHYIEKDVRRELMEHLDKYKERGAVNRNVEEIISLSIDKVSYAEAFLVKYSFSPDPFILFPVRKNKWTHWNPVAVSRSCMAEMEKRGLSFKTRGEHSVSVRDDGEFAPLKEIEQTENLKKPSGEITATYAKTEKLKNADSGENAKAEKKYRVVTKDTQGAVPDFHPSAPYTPIYVIEEKEEA